MEENGVFGLFCCCINSFGCKQNSEVCVKQCEPNHYQKKYVGYVPLLYTICAPKQCVPRAINPRKQELQRFSGQKNEDIRQDRKNTQCPDETYCNICSFYCTYVIVAEGNANGNVALCSHESQVQWGVLCGDDSR